VKSAKFSFACGVLAYTYSTPAVYSICASWASIVT
jgi:hypothetical protein